jgi:carbon monoxide dehydrogenase subunit G
LKISIATLVDAPRDRVFAALVDPAILQRAISGCEALNEIAPDVYQARLRIGLAGLKGTYTGTAAIRGRQPPHALRLDVDGKGGPGFVRGSAAMTLSEENAGAATRVACEADVQVGGLIAAVGSRLVEAAARKLADDFFRQLATELQRSV